METTTHFGFYQSPRQNLWILEKKYQEMELEVQNKKKQSCQYLIRIFPPEEDLELQSIKRKIEDRIIQTKFKRMKTNDFLLSQNQISCPILLDFSLKYKQQWFDHSEEYKKFETKEHNSNFQKVDCEKLFDAQPQKIFPMSEN